MKKGILKRAAAAVCSAALLLTVSGINRFRTSEAVSEKAVISDEIGLVGNLFCIGDGNNADNAALQWATTLPADSYTLYRSTKPDGNFTPIYSGIGTSFRDNALQSGVTYYYQLKVTSEGNELFSEVKELTPCELPSGLNTYDNQKGSSLVYQTSGYKVGNTYYNYSLRKHSGKDDIYLEETTSADGRNFGNARNAADSSQNSALESCKIESVHIDYIPEKNKVVVWAHWEKPSGYNDGKALVITGTPGGQFTVHHVYNPLGIQVRDMAMFFDDDGTGYLIAAANKEGQGANATIYIFRMNDDYSDVTEIVTTLFDNQYREFPNLIKKDGYYFLFTSQAAGWYPSSGAYSVTKDIYGEWSELRSIGNTSTFSSQSGWVVNLNDRNYLMHAYRWLRASTTSGTTLCPLYFDNGFAFYDYYPYFRYNTSTGDLYPVQQGELLSQDRPASSSLAAKDSSSPARAFDGSYQTSFTAIGDYKKWPFYLQVDLERVCELSNIQTSWYICKGSEGYYTYTVEGSLDGKNWTKLLDHTDKNSEEVCNTYGFNSNMLSGKARYVRLNVHNATLHNNPTNNWYTPTVYEVKVFGTPLENAAKPTPFLNIDFENGTGSLGLNGNASIENDPEMGKVLYLDGSSDTYGKLPDGTMDGLRDYTVSMDIKSDSEGQFFTFTAGRNNEEYMFFRVAKDRFRFAATTNSWRDETELIYDIDGTQWHNYTLVVSGADTKLYIDGKETLQTTETHGQIADMGTGTSCYIGKSYYAEDSYFKGSIGNIKIYDCALTASEVAETQLICGDVNMDGEFNISDVVLLQNWILCRTDSKLSNWKAADLCADGELNVFDLCLMKRRLFEM